MPALFVFLSVPLVLQGMSSHPTFCGTVFFAESWNTGMTWMRNVAHSLALKRASVMKKCGTLVFFTLAARRRKHLSPLSSTQIRCLYLFRVDEINPEWGTVGQRERGRERESNAGQRGKTRKQLGIQLLVCVHVSRWHLLESHLCSVRRLERWPAALTSFQSPPAAAYPASTCPPHACTNPFKLSDCLYNVI